MGGSVKNVIRKENGKIHIIDGWTNSMPWFCNNVKFITKDEKHVDDYIDRYDVSDTFAPDGYGLVVFDQMNNKIYTHQNYCAFGDFHKAGLAMSIRGKIMGEREDDSVFNDFIQLLKVGRIARVEGANPKVDIPLEPINQKSFCSCSMENWLSYNNVKIDDDGEPTKDGYFRLEELLRSFPVGPPSEKDDRVFEEALFFKIDMSPFEIINFDGTNDSTTTDNSDGFYAMLGVLKQDGFEFTKKDMKAWEQWLNDEYE